MAEAWQRDGYTISTDPARIDLDAVHAYLVRSYWAAGVPRDIVATSLEHSLSFGLYDATGRQVGLARVVTDYSRFAYVADVYVLEEHRGRGLGVWLMEVVAAHPRLQGIQRWMLGTRDAHGLYEKTGFTAVEFPDRWMEIAPADFYGARKQEGIHE